MMSFLPGDGYHYEMKLLFYIPIVLSLAVIGAHFMRYGSEIGVVAPVALIGLLVVRRAWVARLVQVALVLGTLEWVRTIYELVQIRTAQGAPVTRMVVILGLVAIVTLGSALLFQSKTMKEIYWQTGEE